MSTLTIEAERRFLGAMLADRTIDPGETITATDFSNPAYGAVYSAIGYARANSYLEGPELSAQVAQIADAPGIDLPTLELMRAEAPDDRDQLVAYGRMITEASFLRQMRDLVNDAQGAEQGPDPELPRDLALLLRGSDSALEVLNRQIDLNYDQTHAPEPGSRTALEEQLVASLLANPDQVRTIVEIAPPENLDDFRCRTAYEFIASTAWDRDPVSDLDLLYQLGKAEQLLVNSGHDRPDYREPDAAFIQRLQESPTGVHAGAEAAREIAAQEARLEPTQQRGLSPFENDLTAGPDVAHATQLGPAGPQPGLEGGR